MAQKKTAQSGPNLSARVDPELLKRAWKHAIDEGVSRQQLVARALEEYLKKRGA